MSKLRREGCVGSGQEIEVSWGHKRKHVSVEEFTLSPTSLHAFMLSTWDRMKPWTQFMLSSCYLSEEKKLFEVKIQVN